MTLKKIPAVYKWNTFAGGTCAASNKNSYSLHVEFGRYMVSPVSSKHNVEHHLGYNVWFLNEKGKLHGPLWQQLGFGNLQQAHRMCQKHFEANSTPAETPEGVTDGT